MVEDAVVTNDAPAMAVIALTSLTTTVSTFYVNASVSDSWYIERSVNGRGGVSLYIGYCSAALLEVRAALSVYCLCIPVKKKRLVLGCEGLTMPPTLP